MKTLETDIEIAADGSIRLLSSLPEWLKPGRAHVVLTVADTAESKAKRTIPRATPEMIARRMVALKKGVGARSLPGHRRSRGVATRDSGRCSATWARMRRSGSSWVRCSATRWTTR